MNLDPHIPRITVNYDTAKRRNFYITDSGTMMPRCIQKKSDIWYVFEVYADFNAIRSDGEHFKWIVNPDINENFDTIRESFKTINGWIPGSGTIPAFCIWLNRQETGFNEIDVPEQVNVESIRMEMILSS